MPETESLGARSQLVFATSASLGGESEASWQKVAAAKTEPARFPLHCAESIAAVPQGSLGHPRLQLCKPSSRGFARDKKLQSQTTFK